MTITEAQIARQIELENEMLTMGIARYRAIVAAAVRNKDEASTKAGSTLLSKAVERMAGAVANFVAEASTGKVGRRATAVKFIELLEPEVVAFLTARTVIDIMSQHEVPLQTVIKRIGRALQDEVQFRDFMKQQPHLWNLITKELMEEGVGSKLRQTKLRNRVGKYEVDTVQWVDEERALVGAKCLELLMETTGICEKHVIKLMGGKVKAILRPTKEVVEWVNEANQRSELLSPVMLPMVIPPRDWTGPDDGGYLCNAIGSQPLVKSHTRGASGGIDLQGYEMPVVYNAVNTIQRTPWQINAEVYSVIKTLVDAQSSIGKLSSAADEELLEFPEDKSDKEAVAAWCQHARTVHSLNAKRRSKRIALIKAMWIAAKFKDEEAIYFPQVLDFRGRVYSRPVFLNPQGPDHCKGMLRFAVGKPLGEQGACWLAIHGANTYGYDKAGLQERVDWVTDNEEDILASAQDPLNYLWWTKADKPFQFLAFCFEWAGFRREGEAFASKLPVALDGSCNGLQNFSMALRDEVGGAAVNLVPQDKPADIYQRVADVVLPKVRLDASTQGSVHQAIAQEWLDSGLIGRKLCKQPVMTLPYGAKQYGMRSGIVEFIAEQMEEGQKCFTQKIPAAIYIGRIIWESIGEVVIAARAAMGFLQECARVAGKEGKGLKWVAPSGFPVLQEYREPIGRRLKTQIGGEIVRLWLMKDGDTLDKKHQSSGVSPNWVHSLDSSHLMFTVNLASTNGVNSFATVHDSFGTHAADTPVLGAALRQAFVEQYRRNVLEEFRDAVAATLSEEGLKELPQVPPMGTLDPEAVLDSDFFFA